LISDGGFFENGASGVEKAESDKELKECLDIIREEIKRLDETVTRFMQYSKDIKLNRESTDINKLIQRAINIMTPVFEQKKARVVFNAAGANENLNCSIDGVLFYQVILNIVKNSAEAVFENGNVSAVSYRERDKINIKIANDGPEIAQENLSKIFDFYFTTKIEGSGIGLALSKKIIEAHGGDISVKSDKNETCFLISIPCRAE
ncbi:MAG TPA: ATP-binding protein, partial [Candidatus Wallbacteria bacterium]|nr:ATP-binding protein [Candidatus Wallbacteria bacterium]